jgi:RNA polymerase-binding protein DksA
MSELSAQQLQHFKQRLEERFRQLREEIRQELLKSEDPYYQQLATTVHDSEEESVADLLFDLNLADIDRHVQEIRQIEAAQNRMATGSYGICVDCGIAISPKRLEANPAAARCIECQSLYEQQYAQPGHPSL